MNAREIKIGIGLVFLAVSLWFGWRALQPAAPPEVAAPAAAVSGADEESTLLKEYSPQQLIEATNLLRIAFDQTVESEGDPANIAGCSFSHEEAERYLNGLHVLLDDAKATERRKYIANPEEYVRSSGIAQCEENCACSGFAELLRDPESPAESPAETQEIVAKLTAQGAKVNQETVFMCASKQDWFCKSRLHHYLENDSAGN